MDCGSGDISSILVIGHCDCYYFNISHHHINILLVIFKQNHQVDYCHTAFIYKSSARLFRNYHTVRRNPGNNILHKADNPDYNFALIINIKEMPANYFFNTTVLLHPIFMKWKRRIIPLLKITKVIYDTVKTAVKSYFSIKVTPRPNNFFACVIRRTYTIIDEKNALRKKKKNIIDASLEKLMKTIKKDIIKEFGLSYYKQYKGALAYNVMKKKMRPFTQIFNVNEQPHKLLEKNKMTSRFPVKYNKLLINTGIPYLEMRDLVSFFYNYGYIYTGKRITATSLALYNLERLRNSCTYYNRNIIKEKRLTQLLGQVRYLIKKAGKYKPWFPKPVWKKILKRFKYNRPAIFAHYKLKRITKQNPIQYFKYYYGLTRRTHRFFLKYNKQTIIHSTIKTPQAFTLTNMVQNLPTLISNFFVAATNVISSISGAYIRNFIKKTTVTFNSHVNIVQLKRRYNLHFHKKKRHNARLEYVYKTKIMTWKSAGKLGFHSNKRTTPFAAESIGKFIARYLKKRHINFINLEFSQPLMKKIRSFYKGVNRTQLQILRLYYKRKVMFGSIRKPKQRRV